MPISWTRQQTPRGKGLLLVRMQGEVTAADAQDFLAQVEPDGAFHKLPRLEVVDVDASFSLESQRLFVQAKGNGRPVARVVVKGSVPGKMMSLLHNMNLLAAQASDTITGHNVVFAESEEQAMRWLDTEVF